MSDVLNSEPSSLVPSPPAPSMSLTSIEGANKRIPKLAFPGESDNLGAPTASSCMYLMLTSATKFLNLCEAFIPNVFLFKVEFGIISLLSKLEYETRTLDFSVEEETATVLINVCPPS